MRTELFVAHDARPRDVEEPHGVLLSARTRKSMREMLVAGRQWRRSSDLKDAILLYQLLPQQRGQQFVLVCQLV